MAFQNQIGKYIIGAVFGVALVVGCGGGNSGNVNSAGAAQPVVTAQLFCWGNATSMAGVMGGSPMTCQSSISATVQNFASFNAITQQGWTMVAISSTGGAASAFLFNK